MSESMHNLRMEGTAQRVADGDLHHQRVLGELHDLREMCALDVAYLDGVGRFFAKVLARSPGVVGGES